MKAATYETDRADRQWQRLRRFLPAAKKRGRPRSALREVLNGSLYTVKTGAQWRLTPKNFPRGRPSLIFSASGAATACWPGSTTACAPRVRQAVGKPAQPTAASRASQTVRASAHGGEVGCAAAKKTKGRRRFLLGATLGLRLGVTLAPAAGWIYLARPRLRRRQRA
jgi:putative transposase